MSVAVVLSGNDGPPASPVYVGGSGFGAFEGVDIYFDTVALGLAGTDASGSFGGVLTHVPAGAEPGIHLISAAGRESGLFAQAAFTVNTDWAQIGYSARHSGWNPHENTLQPDNVSAIDLAWTFSASFISSPVVVGRLAYIADGYGTVYALDAGTGAQVWTNPTGAGYAASSPAVADGVVYIGVNAFTAVNAGTLYAFDAGTGAELWTFPTGGLGISSPAVADGVVYIGSSDGNVYAVDAATGAELWSYPAGWVVESCPTVANEVVYIASAPGDVFALEAATGAELWTLSIGADLSASPVVVSGVVYISAGDGNLYALNAATGSELWAFAPDGYQLDHSAAVADGVVYTGSFFGHVYALEAVSGAVLWHLFTGTYVGSPAVANGVVYIGSADGIVYALDAGTGNELWSFPTNGYVDSAWAVANGIVYFSSTDGTLYACTNLAAMYEPAISRVAGNGTAGDSGDGGPATTAQLFGPFSTAPTADGGFLIGDSQMVRMVSPAGVISRVAGNGTVGYSGDGGPAISAQLGYLLTVAAIPGGGFLIADYENSVVRRVSSAGVINTVAGNGTAGYSGDGGPATGAQLNGPTGVSAVPGGGFLVADWANNVVRMVSAAGVISTVAGNGTAGYSGDDGPATSAELNAPISMSALPGGGFLIADTANNAVRMVSAAGVISTVAGTGTGGYSGDGGPAISAQLAHPSGVAAVAGGGFLISDTYNFVIRMVSAAGVITRVAGTGTEGSSGDGGPATSADLGYLLQVAVTLDGGFLIPDSANNVVHKVAPGWQR